MTMMENRPHSEVGDAVFTMETGLFAIPGVVQDAEMITQNAVLLDRAEELARHPVAVLTSAEVLIASATEPAQAAASEAITMQRGQVLAELFGPDSVEMIATASDTELGNKYAFLDPHGMETGFKYTEPDMGRFMVGAFYQALAAYRTDAVEDTPQLTVTPAVIYELTKQYDAELQESLRTDKVATARDSAIRNMARRPENEREEILNAFANTVGRNPAATARVMNRLPIVNDRIGNGGSYGKVREALTSQALWFAAETWPWDEAYLPQTDRES